MMSVYLQSKRVIAAFKPLASSGTLHWVSIEVCKKGLLPILILLIWWCVAHFNWMPAQILPSPESTWQSLISLAQEDLFWQLGISLQRLVIGVALGVLSGLALGAYLGLSKWADALISPSFYILAIVPTLAWLPLLMLWLGIENTLKIFLIFKASLIPVTIHTQTGVRDIQPQLKEIAQTLQFSTRQLITKLVLPAALPAFMTGVRLALAAAWTTLLVVELLASSEGIGYLMVLGRQLFQLDVVFVCIILIAVVGIGMDGLFHYIEKKLIYWPHAALTAFKPSKPITRPVALLYGLIIPVILLAIWLLSTELAWLDAAMLPSPNAVISALATGLVDGSLSQPLFYSLYRALVGLLIGASIGVVVGLILGLYRPLGDFIAPTLNTLRLIALFAWIPLITAWFGLDDAAKIIFISLATFFPMFVVTWVASMQIPIALSEVSQILRLKHGQRMAILVLPSITPAIFSGLRLALLYAWMASFGAEYLMGSGVGIGTYMMAAQQHFEMDRVIAATLMVALLGIVLAWIGKRSEHYATAWRNQHR